MRLWVLIYFTWKLLAVSGWAIIINNGISIIYKYKILVLEKKIVFGDIVQCVLDRETKKKNQTYISKPQKWRWKKLGMNHMVGEGIGLVGYWVIKKSLWDWDLQTRLISLS